MASGPVRIGLIGASEIARIAIVEPARDLSGAVVTAVAARDPERARSFAAEWGISAAAAGYDDLIDRDDVDLVYISLPNTLHQQWAERALRAGKHVLLEKPAAPTMGAARAMLETSNTSGMRLIEAFHYRYHPLFARVLEIVAGGEIGRLRTIDSTIDVPLPISLGANRWTPAMGGGALMELGCYPVHWTRMLVGPIDIVEAGMHIAESGVDDRSSARFVARDLGVTGTISCSMAPHDRGRLTTLKIVGETGEIFVRNPVAPQMGYEFRWQHNRVWREETLSVRTSYACQLEAICLGLAAATPLPTEGEDIAANIAVIEAIRVAAAGVNDRGST